MIFQHTIDAVLSGAKTQTSRIWKDTYNISGWRDDGSPKLKPLEVSSVNTATLADTRKLYYVGQVLSVQSARGQKGIAKIRVLELAKRDVRDFTQDDIVREGFEIRLDFMNVWCAMHDKALYKWCYQHPATPMDLLYHVQFKPIENYLALVINFELLTVESKAA